MVRSEELGPRSHGSRPQPKVFPVSLGMEGELRPSFLRGTELDVERLHGLRVEPSPHLGEPWFLLKPTPDPTRQRECGQSPHDPGSLLPLGHSTGISNSVF